MTKWNQVTHKFWKIALTFWLFWQGMPPTLPDAFSGERRYHALLVGVSDYPSLTEKRQLRGPAADVTLMRDLLLRRGVDRRDITLLADGVADSRELPTRQAILAALARLANAVGPDDYVYLHFSGHGSQAPASLEDGSETDGLDEIFLPRDIGHWDGQTGKVENAITDNEFHGAITAMRQRGAFVWSVFDTCHAGTMIRSQKTIGNTRHVPPGELGIPPATRKAGGEGNPTRVSPSSLPVTGGMVAFFASQSDQETRELPLPPGSSQNRIHGRFSYTLAQVLNNAPHATYGQIAQQILHLYAMEWENSTPLFAGSNLDIPAFTSGEALPSGQWRVRRQGETLTLEAGAMHLLNVGNLIALFPDATASEKERLGYGKVVETGLDYSLLQLVDHDGLPSPVIQRLPGLLQGRLVTSRQIPPLTLALTAPPSQQTRDRILYGAIQTVQQQKKLSHFRWLNVGDDADVRLSIQEGILEIYVGEHMVARIAGQENGETLTREITDLLQRVGQTTRLLRMTRLVHQHSGKKNRLEVSIQRRRSPSSSSDCHARVLEAGGEKIGLSQVPQLNHCDQLTLQMTNRSSLPLDVTVLALSSDHHIEALFPADALEINRIETGGNKVLQAVVQTKSLEKDAPPAREHLLFIVTEGRPQAPRNDFSFWADSITPRGEEIKPFPQDTAEIHLFTWLPHPPDQSR